MESNGKYFEANKKLWNDRTNVHIKSDFYDVEGFKKGKTSLKFIELEELGDVKGKSILHLQCHFGQDSLSLARMGAKVTGIDISEKAIEEAKKLNNELSLNAEFICCNVYDIEKYLNEKFDIVFTSYGVIGWLPDLSKWAELISKYLKPGGMFYMVEFHPYIWIFDDDFDYFKYSYFHTGKPIEDFIEGTYTDRNADISGTDYCWNHDLSYVFTCLMKNGLQIKSFKEFPFSVYNVFPGMEKIGEDKFVIKKFGDKIPYLYSLKALKGKN
ncbi:MAG: class I SAM-dependent methyltransferase [Ignavibacteria bacterium]|jgi:SAM-dependent methyltransferase